jgi:hypothetical protein
MRPFFSVLVLALLLLLAACGPADPEPGAPGPTPTPATEPELPGEAAEAVAAARSQLATRIGADPADIAVVSTSQMDWPDGCLGLAEPDEMCTQAIVPGWLVILRAPTDDVVYEARTDQTGNTVRFQQTADPGAELPVAAVRAREELAAQLGVAVEEVDVLEYEQVEWPDSCLGLPEPTEMCAQVITPGWLVTLLAGNQRYEAHTTRQGETVRIGSGSAEGSRNQREDAAIVFEQSGGFAGTQITYLIYDDRPMERLSGPAGPDQRVEAVPIDPAAVDQLLSALERAGFFKLNSDSGSEVPCCDFFVYELTATAGTQKNTITVVETGDNQSAPEWQYVDLVRAFIDKYAGSPTS